MTSETSPMCVSGVLGGVFEKLPRLVFITINPNKGLDLNLRINKIGKWSDFLRKISSNFIIVRELTGGIHFHALVSLNKDKQMKYIKNVHFNYQEVSGKCVIPDKGFEFMNLTESLESIAEVEAVLEIRKNERRELTKIINDRSKTKKQQNVDRIIRYILKDSPRFNLVSYIFIKGDKLQNLYEKPCFSTLSLKE